MQRWGSQSEYEELKKPDRLKYKYLKKKMCVLDMAGHKAGARSLGPVGYFKDSVFIPI